MGKKRTWKQWLLLSIAPFVIIAVLFGLALFGMFIAGLIGYNSNMAYIETLTSVGSAVEAYLDEETGFWTFKTDENFEVLQLTDTHIGAGGLSVPNDKNALSAVSKLVLRTKPDLVIVTGDIVFPSFLRTAATANKKGAEMFIALMEKLDVYWTVSFGNHDTEASLSRSEMADLYESVSRTENPQSKCLFTDNTPEIYGAGNQVINIVNGENIITQALVIIDSNDYLPGASNLSYDYDNVHQDQIDWYAAQIEKLNAANAARGGGAVKSLMFLHIPPAEFGDAWEEYSANGRKDTENVQYLYGEAGEPGEESWGSEVQDNLFETVLEIGSTQGIFCGHDHLNYWAVNYKGVTLSYGMSIDYIAYAGITDMYNQRGGKIITLSPDGTFETKNERLADN